MDISRDIRGYYIIIFPKAAAWLQSAPPAAAGEKTADAATTKREFRRQLGIWYVP